jgi:AraC family transcriptional regulator of adaptative response/methylated-DNA-[protein]-cysteine methyltransferase
MPGADAQRVERAIRFLEEHWRRQPSLEETATAVGLSPYHFQRLFRRWAGVSPKRFVQYLTLDHARAALAEGRSVLETAYDAGLSSASRLHDLFVTFEAVTPGEFKVRGECVAVESGFANTPFGEAFLAQTIRGVCGLVFVDRGGRDVVVDEFRQRWPRASLRRNDAAIHATASRVFATREGHLPLSLDVRGTNFQIKVWEALLRIPAGALASYADIASAIGQPTAQRAVASAVARNPVAYLIPCHRVIRSSGVFGAYRWGTAKKKALVGWEAAQREAAAVAG